MNTQTLETPRIMDVIPSAYAEKHPDYHAALHPNDRAVTQVIIANQYNTDGSLVESVKAPTSAEVAERIKKAYVKYVEDNTPKVNIFDPAKEYSIEIQIGNSIEDTVIKTPNGEILKMATNAKIELDAETQEPSATIKFIFPKIVGKQTKYN